jgi:Ca2+/Na+ antiporter
MKKPTLCFLLFAQCFFLTAINNETFVSNLTSRFGFAFGQLLASLLFLIPISALLGFIPWFMILKIQDKRYEFSKFWVVSLFFLCVFLVLGKSHLANY